MRQSLLKGGLAIAGLFAPCLAMAGDADASAAPGVVAVAEGTTWSLRVPSDKHVEFRGVVSFDDAGAGSNSFLYPAPSPGGFLAAVITHGLIVDSVKKEQKEKLREAADGVLSPYRSVIDGLDLQALSQRAVRMTSRGAQASVLVGEADAGNGVIVDSNPVYSMTQDQKAIILDNLVTIHGVDSTPDNAYRKAVRVVSKASEGGDPAIYWTADGGQRLKEKSAALLARSLDIAFMDSASGNDRRNLVFRTIRYREGGVEKIERAQVLDEQCGRLLIRNLRGALMSVPASRVAADGAGAGSCASL